MSSRSPVGLPRLQDSERKEILQRAVRVGRLSQAVQQRGSRRHRGWGPRSQGHSLRQRKVTRLLAYSHEARQGNDLLHLFLFSSTFVIRRTYSRIVFRRWPQEGVTSTARRWDAESKNLLSGEKIFFLPVAALNHFGMR